MLTTPMSNATSSSASDSAAKAATSSRPINLGLNDGTYAPEACLEVLRRYASRTAFRNYTEAGNDRLRKAIGAVDQVGIEHIYLHNGSGPILKQAVPHIIKTAIYASPMRIAKHLIRKDGFPIITPRFTYSKVPKKAMELGLTVHVLRLEPGNNFRLDLAELEATLERGDGMVYIANPNNPTGNALIKRRELLPLLQRFPRSKFWIDEAYVQYLDPREHEYVCDLVPRYDNLVVSRTFSFAYGMAAARVGYLLGSPTLIRELESQVTDYRIGMLSEDLCIAALEDKTHLPYVRQATLEAVARLRAGMEEIGGIESFPSSVNFVLARFRDGRAAKPVQAALKERGMLIKTFEPFGEHRYDDYFRVTVGLPEENETFLKLLGEVTAR